MRTVTRTHDRRKTGRVAFTLDPARSKVIIRTRAKGLLSALAHDLELTGTIARASATREGDRWDAELAVRPDAIKVVGPIRGGKVAPGGMSKLEVDMCEKRLVSEVFGGVGEIVVRATGTPSDARVEITAKQPAPAKMKLTLRDEGEATLVDARGTVSMKALGLAEVKGPLGAFTVKDDVELEATIALVSG